MNPQEMALAAGMDQLFKASTGGPLFGSQTIGQPVTPGSYNGLLIADLEPMIIHTYQTEADYQAMAVIPKQRAITRNPEFVVDVAQGTRRSTGVLEGQAFGYQFNGAYDRKTTPLKTNLINVSATYQVMENLLMPNYKGDTSGELAALKSEIYQGTLSLMESLNRQLFKGNASILPLEFDGLEALQQEYFGGLAAYQSSDFVVDARGSALTPTIISRAQTRILSLGFAHLSSVGVIGKYTVFDRYTQNLLDSGLVQNNNFINFKYEKAANNYGIEQTGFVTPNGSVKFIRDRFTGRRDHILTSTAGQEGTQAAPAGLSYAAGAGAGSQFATADAGTYFYAIEAVSASGVSVATLVSGTAVTVAANQIVDITVGTPAAGATGDVCEFVNVNFENVKEIGHLTNYRQGLILNGGFYNVEQGFTLNGPWFGGFRVDVANSSPLSATGFVLFKAGTGFTVGNRFVSNANLTINSPAIGYQFTEANFLADAGFQLIDGIFRGTGTYVNGITAGSSKCLWRDTIGVDDTFQGIVIKNTADTITDIITQNVYVELAITKSVTESAWFSANAGNTFSTNYDSLIPINISIEVFLSLSSGTNNEIEIDIRNYKTSLAGGFASLDTFKLTTNGGTLGTRVEPVSLKSFDKVFQGDDIRIFIRNTSANGDIATEAGSKLIITKR